MSELKESSDSSPVSNSSPVQPKKFRRKWIIYPQFQFKMIWTHLMIQATVFFIVWFQFHQSMGNMRAVGGKSFAHDSPFFRLLDDQTTLLYKSLIVGFVVGLALSVWMSVILSHKLAGPIVRLRNYFKKVRETGHVSEPLKFRKNDFFLDIPDEVNGALAGLPREKKTSQDDSGQAA